MKLRNKKTGEIVEVGDRGVGIDSRAYQRYYHTLAEFNEEWEDYSPKQPLIKDEKVRKAVRAWAEVLNIEGVSIEHRCAGELCEVHSVFCGLSMEFDGSIMSDIQDGDYTITELCGEEEE